MHIISAGSYIYTYKYINIHINIYIPEANPNPAGNKWINLSTNMYAGIAIIGWGREVNTAHRPILK
jgi:hypothetical protein